MPATVVKGNMHDSVATAFETAAHASPFSSGDFCRYEPILKRIDHARVLIVNDLLRYASDLSPLAFEDWKGSIETKLRFERKVSAMAVNNIAENVIRLVKNPKTLTVHLSEVEAAAARFRPDAIVMSGTYADFDYYNAEHLDAFHEFIKETKIPVLAICGAHQLVAVSFGAKLKTLDDLELSEKRNDRLVEYQYRFVKIVDPTDPIFAGHDDSGSRRWQEYTNKDDILRVWQNHGVQVEGVPEGFKLLASSYLCRNQMMVKRSDGQLIYSVQFHLEKSFEDWSKNPTRWEHVNESRDGRILFENFLKLALAHRS
ncbi:MAG: gamma-glutamyl-gamma-aminobutyrate hydrolase family protein [Pyrinomonadaceae bacterium]